MSMRFNERWLAHISTEIVLRPTHLLPSPADPPGSITDDGRLLLEGRAAGGA
jgi:hypothetical protein